MRIKILLLAAASASTLAAPVAAKPASQPQQANSPYNHFVSSRTAKRAEDGGICRAEVNSFCSPAQRGNQSVSACLNSHASELSASCKTARAEAAERLRQQRERNARAKAACDADPACKAAQAQAREKSRALQAHKKAERAACGSDVQKFCLDIPAGNGLSNCLKGHEAELSQTCEAFRQTDAGK
jgi:hypothetical protein